LDTFLTNYLLSFSTLHVKGCHVLEETLSLKLTPFFRPADDSKGTIIGFCGSDILMAVDGTLPSLELFALLGEPKHRFHIGTFDEELFILSAWAKETPLPDTLVKTNLRNFLGLYPPHLFAMLARAKQLAHWIYDNQYCGRCGAPVGYTSKFSSLGCACGNFIFPRVSPACITLITKGDEILLARSPYFKEGMYSLLAGFVEAGESVESALHREVYEEVGIRVKNLRYFGSQSWPFPHSLMLGFFAEYESGEIHIQEEEIEDARWFTIDTLPLLSHETSIARTMIEEWRKKH